MVLLFTIAPVQFDFFMVLLVTIAPAYFLVLRAHWAPLPAEFTVRLSCLLLKILSAGKLVIV